MRPPTSDLLRGKNIRYQTTMHGPEQSSRRYLCSKVELLSVCSRMVARSRCAARPSSLWILGRLKAS